MGCLLVIFLLCFAAAALFGVWPVAGVLLIVFLVFAIIGMFGE